MNKAKIFVLFKQVTIKFKTLMKMILSQFARNKLLWNMLGRHIVQAGEFLYTVKEGYIADRMKSIEINKKFSDLIVKHGVFKGMRYPDGISKDCALYAKLLGSYETELRRIMEEVCHENYTEIVNIGCAEGYYAVGLAMRLPNVNVYAYDIDEKLLNKCEKMARLNGVGSRINLHTHCDADTLKKINFRGKALIISDCEGYEKKLFTEDVIPFLKQHDLIIEAHDFVDIEISALMQQRFAKTHSVLITESIDDIQKVKKYVSQDFYEDIKFYDLKTRKTLLTEYRPSIMEWLYLKPKNHSGIVN